MIIDLKRISNKALAIVFSLSMALSPVAAHIHDPHPEDVAAQSIRATEPSLSLNRYGAAERREGHFDDGSLPKLSSDVTSQEGGMAPGLTTHQLHLEQSQHSEEELKMLYPRLEEFRRGLRQNQKSFDRREIAARWDALMRDIDPFYVVTLKYWSENLRNFTLLETAIVLLYTYGPITFLLNDNGPNIFLGNLETIGDAIWGQFSRYSLPLHFLRPPFAAA